MRKLTLALIATISLLHFYIAWFEIFAWTTKGPKIFSTFPPELFEQTVHMAANQGIYNAFLAAGLMWSLFIKDQKWQRNIAVCFLMFVTIAGVVAALTVALKSGLIQIIPAVIALILVFVFMNKKTSDSAD